MSHQPQTPNLIQYHVNQLTSRIISQSGTPSDKYHLGKIIYQSLVENPNMVSQIDGATSQSETNAQCLERSIKCAISLFKMGLNIGDVMVMMAPNHLDLVVPFYAALFLGVTVAPLDITLGVRELQSAFQTIQPKVIFCQSNKVKDVQNALDVDSGVMIITFDDRDEGLTFKKLLHLCKAAEMSSFRPSDFDPEATLAFLLPTSGTTGPPKSTAGTHKSFAIGTPYIWVKFDEFPPIKSAFVVAPLQWLSTIVVIICSPYIQYTRIQSSEPITRDLCYTLINRYKPQFMITSPTFLTNLMKESTGKCDYGCFKKIFIAGSAVHKDYIEKVKNLSPHTDMISFYGMSEISTPIFRHTDNTPAWSCGTISETCQVKLVDLNTKKEIKESNIRGEMWLKGPCVFQGYYRQPEATANAFEDGWFKTGDLFYRDEDWNFYFVDRIKLLLKYKNHQISPAEIEAVIHQHPGVSDVAVTAVLNEEDGESPVACVVVRPGHGVTAQEIKDLVRDSLADSKRLRGGVVFMEQLPMTASTKIHRRKLKEMVKSMELS